MSQIQVTLIDHMGTDLTVVNAARVSFAKQSQWQNQYQVPSGDDAPHYVQELSAKDKGLINFLARNNHWTPFGHPQVQLHVKAPIFVARQAFKHKVGLVENEVSRRYVTDEPEFYRPIAWRVAAENVKQGSGGKASTAQSVQAGGHLGDVEHACLMAYRALLGTGIAPEQARMVLPLSLMTEWHWTGSIAAWARVYHLRGDETEAQEEIKELAGQIYPIMNKLFPVSWAALTNAA